MKAIELSKNAFSTRVTNPYNLPDKWEFLGNRPAVIDFYAPWCGPCMRLAPVLELIASEYDGKVDIYKINVDDEPELAAKFDIRSIPTLIFIPLEGKPQRISGVIPRQDITGIIDTMIV